MKIKSLIRDNNSLLPVEVEISFLPGLPQIQFLGLPDQVIKESIFRIKSAIRSQGFNFPRSQHILVNVRPSHLKKSSRGLELAVALAILWETEQLPLPQQESVIVYGELSLKGQVMEPDDLCEDFDAPEGIVVWTGSTSREKASFTRYCLKDLAGALLPEIRPGRPREFILDRPQFGLKLEFSSRAAELLKLISLGEHSLLLAGPSGSGKSTLAKSILSFLQAPSQSEMAEIIQNNKGTGKEILNWRPMVTPHHSTSPLGLIGGGVPPFKGDMSRAHRGLLVLDELLEFHPRAQEALREPMEEFCIRLRRGRFVEEHPAETLVISTTNLCPCGDWTPQSKTICGRSLRKCKSYLDRLSGPIVDRFQVLHFTKKREVGPNTSGEDILAEIEDVRSFRESQLQRDLRYKKVAGRWSWSELIADLPEFFLKELFPKELISKRRDLATLRVARTLADIDHSEKTQPQHVEKALKLTYTPFEGLRTLAD